MRAYLMTTACLALGMFLAGGAENANAAGAKPKVQLNEADFRDRVLACWMGKNIGGTLGMPFEGNREPRNIDFYTNLKAGEPAANDDLDLQLLWLKAMEDHDGQVDARILGEYWLRYVPVDWNEYGVGKRNMRRGILPPLSGEFENAKWKPSNGAWIRSEIWACLAPGCPGLAARMAREDACVDHGAAEGTLAEIFTASVESAAFVEKDRDKLIAIGLSMIPQDCGVAKAIRAALQAKQEGKTWQEARLDVLRASEETGWFQAPRNVAFVVIGWIYGDGDFGKSICTAVNCGDDTDCTGATLGSILGILNGTAGIPARWSEPIGLKINTVAVRGFNYPADLNELTDRTVAMTRKVLAKHQAPVALTAGQTDLRRAKDLKLFDTASARALWELSPYQIVWNEAALQATLDYQSEPWIEADAPRDFQLTLRNRSTAAQQLWITLADLPAGWQIKGLPVEPITIARGQAKSIPFSLTAPDTDDGQYHLAVAITGGAQPVQIPLALFSKDKVGAADLALAAKGATVTADSEYAQEAPCAGKVIDGVIAAPDDFSNRWHSSLETPHPHWIQVKLPRPELVGRVVLRFADPEGYPVRFEGLVIPAGETEFKPVFQCEKNSEPRRFTATFPPVQTDTFRLLIHASASPHWPNAAQLSEIELYPPTK